jgi:hypothetical protein
MLTPEAKGRRAQEILDDDVFKEAQEHARQGLISRWTQELDREKRDRLWHEYQALGATTTALRVFVGDADVTKARRQKQERNHV